jgi:predicted nucleic acid-binding protein
MILLDTNIVSEPIKPRPDPNVRRWIDAQPTGLLFICAPVLAELHVGVERLSSGARRNRLKEYLDYLENDLYRGRVLDFDAAAATSFGRLVAARMRLGRPIQQMDALIAAVAHAHGATLATRDIDGFAHLDLTIVNPFEQNVV